MLTRHIREFLQVTPGPFPIFWVGPGDEASLLQARHISNISNGNGLIDSRAKRGCLARPGCLSKRNGDGGYGE